MNSSKVKTQNTHSSSKSPRSLSGQKTLSALLAIALAFTTIFQAGATTSKEVAEAVSAEEASLIAEIDEMFEMEAMEMEIEEAIFFETLEEDTQEVRVYDINNELIGEGNPDVNPLLNRLVNQGDYLSEMGGTKYYRVAQ